jgi:hypothetical protein
MGAEFLFYSLWSLPTKKGWLSLCLQIVRLIVL